MNVSKVTDKDFHMGDSMRLFDLLATDRIDRVVLNAEAGPMGATEVTWWNSKIGLILEKHSSNGGESLIIHPASATTCPGHGRSECVSCCWPKGEEQAPVQTCQIGIYGRAYDGPGVTRAYTYRHQPDNVGASKLGQACCHASKKPGGDFIDQGLGLLMYLENAGFGVFEVQS